MLPRVRGGDGALAAEEEAVETAAAAWEARGFRVERFVEGVVRPEWQDRILPSTGHREAQLVAVGPCASQLADWGVALPQCASQHTNASIVSEAAAR